MKVTEKRITLRIPERLANDISRAAQQNKRSWNREAEIRLEQSMERDREQRQVRK